MNCKQCNTGLTGRQREFCSDKCRKRASRTEPRSEDAPQSTNADNLAVERGQSEPGQPIDGWEDCYHRPATWCSEFGMRPSPLDPADQPVPMNRGRYKRADGTVYQFDSKGQHFECLHPFKDKYGKDHMATASMRSDQAASLQHYQANPDKYATRAEPELLNWGQWMTADQLAAARLKANRVTIPGDWDFQGAAAGSDVPAQAPVHEQAEQGASKP